MENKIQWSLFCICFLLFISCCKDKTCMDASNPACENYNPCWDKVAVSADFEMSEIYNFVLPEPLEQFNPDVAFRRSKIGFRPTNFVWADTSNYTFTWHLGREIINEPIFTRDFSDTKLTSENNILISLVVQKKSYSNCYGPGNSRDSTSKFIKLVDGPCQYLTHGDFKVLFEGEKDSVIIGVRNWRITGPPSQGFPIIDTCAFGQSGIQYIGFDRTKSKIDTFFYAVENIQFNSKIYILGFSVEDEPFSGIFEVNPNSLGVQGHYQILDSQNKLPYFSFKGRKIK